MPFYLAIDAGGTKTDYLLADETRELARVRSATIKRLRVDADTAARTLDEALAQLSALGGISLRDITRTCIGTAGESVPLVADWLRESFAARVSGDLLLLGDVEIALDAAFPGQPGILVLAGTGSNVAGRAPSGTITTAGGWGPALADQGSGHRIGSEALRATFLAIDEQAENDPTTPTNSPPPSYPPSSNSGTSPPSTHLSSTPTPPPPPTSPASPPSSSPARKTGTASPNPSSATKAKN